MTEIKLEKLEVYRCACHAVEQVWYADAVGAKKHHGGTSKREWGTIFGHYVLGGMAELALSRHLGVPWEPTLGDYESADLSGLCEVKTSAHPYSGMPLYKSQYHPEKLMTFVRFDKFTANLMGWIFGKEAKEVGEWKDNWDTPCWRVDAKHLKPIETMPMDGRRFVRERK